MRIPAILPAFAMLAANVHAQTPALKPGSVDGVVSATVSTEPVKKAVVTLIDAQTKVSHTAITDVQGHFQFDSVNPGAYFISAARDGFQAASRQSQLQITVAEDQHVQDLALKLVPLAIVSGHVLDDDGEPVLRAQIDVLEYSYAPGRKRLRQTTSARSNDLGEFEALNIPPGRYYFQVTAPPLLGIPPHTRWAVPEEAYPVTFYPNAREIGQATPTDIAPGAHVTNIDLRLHKAPAYHIRGTASQGTGTAIPGTSFMVNARWSGSIFAGIVAQSPVGPDGSFDLRGMPSGSYKVSCVGVMSGRAINEYQTVQVSDSDVNGVALTPEAFVDVSGTVSVEGPQPEKMDVQFVLSSSERIGRPGNGHAGGDGKLLIETVPAEVYDLHIFNLPPGKYVKSIRFGDREIGRGEIDLTERSNAALNIVLGDDGGEVDGNVQSASGQPSPATRVTLAPAGEYDGRSELLKISVTDAAGNFQVKDVAPGEYKVFAWESDPDGSSQSAEFRKPFESRSVAVTVGSKVKTSAQLSVITADEMEKERSKLP